MERKVPVSLRLIPWILLGCAAPLFAPRDATAQGSRGAVRDGNRLFEEGRFAEARQRYLDALREDPNSSIIRFNEGNALYESAEFQQALESYQQAIASGDRSLQADAWYNLGNAMYRQQMFQESAEAYRQALRLDPSDRDAKHNLEWVLKQMQEQQNQQNDQQQDQNQDQNEEQENQQQNQEDQQEENEQQQQQQQPESQQQDQPDQQPEGEQQANQPPPPMSREEAERLLDAIDENPNELRRPPPARGARVRTRKPW